MSAYLSLAYNNLSGMRGWVKKLSGRQDDREIDWFERLTGFREGGYDATRAQLDVDGPILRSKANGRSYRIGELELVSLDELRTRAREISGGAGRLTLKAVQGDVRALHSSPTLAGALFQVASQFNLLEMTSPGVTPEDGVTRYASDRTQGPACAIAAGAATLYRNYFVPVGGDFGQTEACQIDGLADLGAALSARLRHPVKTLWEMKNGYALCATEGLVAIGELLEAASPEERDVLRGALRVGFHRHVEVTDPPSSRRPGPLVSQVFCSALPVAYSHVPARLWAPFATLVLEAAYEATLWAGLINAQATGSNIVLLTRLGGGAFGNADAWIDGALRFALERFRNASLDIRIVMMRPPAGATLEILKAFA